MKIDKEFLFQKSFVILMVIIVFILAYFLIIDKKNNSSINSGDIPAITSINLIDSNGNVIKQSPDKWYKLSKNTEISVSYSNTATQVDFYTIPTGTNTYLLQKCVGSINVSPNDTHAVLKWTVPDDFRGNIFVIVYNKDIARTSNFSDKFFIKAYL
jgi:hypothetical protein